RRPRPAGVSRISPGDRSVRARHHTSGSGAQAQLPERALVVPPFGLDLDEEAEEDAGPEHPLDLLAGGAPDGLQDGATAADDDPLLGVPLHENHGVDLDQAVLARPPALDEDGERMGNLLPRRVQELLADPLRRKLALGLV